MYKLLAIFLVLSICSACKKKSTDAIIFGYEYFPITKGHYVVYDVLTVFHDLALEPQHDTNRFQIKEVVGETFKDNEGEIAHKLKRFKRSSTADNWALEDVWTMKRTPQTAEVVEENDRIIKLIFAIAYDRSWDCNALNNEDKQTCYYENIYEPFSIGNENYDSTVTVEKENFTSFIDFKRKYDVYARGVGKVYSVSKELQIDNFDTTAIQKGRETFYTLTDFGIE